MTQKSQPPSDYRSSFKYDEDLSWFEPVELLPGADFQALQKSQASDVAPVKTEAEAVQLLNDIGTSTILENIAHGSLPFELALKFDVPVLVFRKWLTQNVTTAQMSESKNACAEAMMYRAQLALTQVPRSGPEGTIIKAYADRLTSMAERLDPRQWGPPKTTEPPAPPVVINITGEVPGLDAFNTMGAPKTIEHDVRSEFNSEFMPVAPTVRKDETA